MILVVLGLTIGATNLGPLAAAAVIATVGSFLLPVLIIPALLLVSQWPLLYAGEGRTGVLIAALGGLLGFRLARRGVSLLVQAFGRRTILASAAAGSLGVLAALSSWPPNERATSILILFGSTCLAMFLAGGVSKGRIPMNYVIVLGVPLLFLEVVAPTLAPGINPISLGHVSWIVALSALLSPRLSQLARYAVVVLAAMVLLPLSHLAPPLAAGSAAAFVMLKLRPGQARVVTRSRQALIALSVISPFVLWVGLSQLNLETQQQELNNVNARAAAWEDIVKHPTLAGRGIADLPGMSFGKAFEIGHAHNFLLDALSVTGVLGLGATLCLLYMALRGTRKAGPEAGILLGLLVAACFSGGIFYSPPLWFALGGLIGLDGDTARHESLEGGRAT